jgi:hypothetical protein
LEEVITLSPIWRSVMAFTGYCDDQQLATLVALLNAYCAEYGITEDFEHENVAVAYSRRLAMAPFL